MKMRILALAVNLKDWVVDTLWREQQALAKALSDAGGEMVFHGPGFDYVTNEVSTIIANLGRKNWRPDLILCYLNELDLLGPLAKPFAERYNLIDGQARFPLGLERVTDIPKVLWINDFWHLSPSQWEQALLGHGFSDALATYSPPFVRRADFDAFYSPRVQEFVRFHPLPRGIDPNIFLNYGEERSVDVTLLGALGKHFYPLRNFFHESLQAQTWLKYFHEPHPGYTFRVEGTLVGQAYARALARTKIHVTCTTRFNLPLIKLGETLASGALLMCDRPNGAEELGLLSGHNYVEIDHTNFLVKLQYYLKHEEERYSIAEAGRRLFEERHSVQTYAIRARETLEKILARHQSGDSQWFTFRKPHRSSYTAKAEPIFRGLRKVQRAWKSLRIATKVFLNGLSKTSATDAWEPVKGGTRLDWKYVSETEHVLNLVTLTSVQDLEQIERFGVNAQWGDQPVITQHPEVVTLRPIFLRKLASALDAMTLCEVGTARGLQSVFWAQYLESNGISQERVFTCDIQGQDEPIYYTPLSGDNRWTRRELWAFDSCTQRIRFVHGDSKSLAEVLGSELPTGRTLDLVFIDGEHTETSVKADYLNLKRFLSDKSVLVFDDCDPRFPGIEKGVTEIAKERNQKIQLITFLPSPYCVAILGNPFSLQELAATRHRKA
jgi:predicted O-methyltransferase YrrM